MTPRIQENLIAGALLVIFGVFALICLRFGPNARLVPLPMALLGFVLVLGYLLTLNIRPTATVTTVKNETDGELSKQSPRELQAFAGVTAFVVLIALFGPVIAVFLFSSGYLVFSGHAFPARSIVIATIFTTIIYLLFVVGLQLQLYHGILEPIFR